MFKALLKALAERGHTVEVASPYRTPGPLPENYTDIIIPIPQVDRREILKFLVNVNYSPIKEHIGIWLAMPLLCETHLSSPELRRFLSQGSAADVILGEKPNN
ncbi:hypothetical protein J437_LFUL013741 [Ladona fulva]|uniref:UDP-glycosyltransferase n=1 Tax=Ladona fulva TaxID=123851 RepID=A0A8K0KEG9_LADFU|nr:hypothetical protein J437_LFUL013741 [Ladona fulva]